MTVVVILISGLCFFIASLVIVVINYRLELKAEKEFSDHIVDRYEFFRDKSAELQKKSDEIELNKVCKMAGDIERNFTYHPPKPGQPEKYQAIRNMAKELALLIDAECPHSRERSIAATDLENCVMWANASIARHE